jgi:AcrR family transcriptional regulator
MEQEEKNQEKRIQEAYLEYVLEHGQQPPSIYAFAKNLGMPEAEFYEFYNSFDGIEKALWKVFFDRTLDRLHNNEVYAQYSVREKLLSFYYTWVEELRASRSFVLFSLRRSTFRSSGTPPQLVAFKKAFLAYVRELLAEGQESKEVVYRPILFDRYADGLWVQLMFVLNFWIADDSLHFEKTDAAIEKAVNTSFDLMGRLPVDSVVDFAKFLYQNR